jgi:hypothetical protein
MLFFTLPKNEIGICLENLELLLRILITVTNARYLTLMECLLFLLLVLSDTVVARKLFKYQLRKRRCIRAIELRRQVPQKIFLQRPDTKYRVAKENRIFRKIRHSTATSNSTFLLRPAVSMYVLTSGTFRSNIYGCFAFDDNGD